MPVVDIRHPLTATPEEAWEELRHIDRHVHWMLDAAEIRFLTEQREGVGTTFECDTKVGPLKTTDIMEVTEWTQGRSIRVRHVGVVTGEGTLTIEPSGSGSVICWYENIRLPLRLGGRVGDIVARPILDRIWRGNLRRFAERLSS